MDVADLYRVQGEVSDVGGAAWSLSARYSGTNQWKQFAEGSGNSVSGPLATFDPTVLKNGVYELMLYARDLAGNVAYDTGCVLVDGRLKIGHVALPATDVSVPNN